MDEIGTSLLVLVGGAFMLLAGVGILRMPDLFMRMQAATKGATLGVGCLLAAFAVHYSDIAMTARAILVIALVALTVPVAAHLIARAAYSVGVPLWDKTLVDELRGTKSDRRSLAAGQELNDAPQDDRSIDLGQDVETDRGLTAP
jgi:multicomponent Na+:H+ antiporter subunit G